MSGHPKESGLRTDDFRRIMHSRRMSFRIRFHASVLDSEPERHRDGEQYETKSSAGKSVRHRNIIVGDPFVESVEIVKSSEIRWANWRGG